MKCTDNCIIKYFTRICLFLTGLFMGTGVYGIVHRIYPIEVYFILLELGLMFFICSLISVLLYCMEWLHPIKDMDPHQGPPCCFGDVKVVSPLSLV